MEKAEKRRKNLCIDVGEAVHRKAKTLACSQGMSLKAFVANLVEREARTVEIFIGEKNR